MASLFFARENYVPSGHKLPKNIFRRLSILARKLSEGPVRGWRRYLRASFERKLSRTFVLRASGQEFRKDAERAAIGSAIFHRDTHRAFAQARSQTGSVTNEQVAFARTAHQFGAGQCVNGEKA